MKKTIKILLLVIILLLILFFIVFAYIANKWEKINFVNLFDENDIAVNKDVDEKLHNYRNIAILGLDAKNKEGTSRTDCIIIASLDEVTNEVKLVSIYRDTYLKIPGNGFNRVNSAYTYGDVKLTLDTINTNLDLNITEFVLVDFEATKNIINKIGGVKITVTDKEARQITGIDKAGTYNLTGEQALQYGRIRKIDNDYARTERMRKVLTATFEKVKGLNLVELNSLLNEVLPEISTNINIREMFVLLPKTSTCKITDSVGWPYETKGFTLENGSWIGPPVNLEKNVIELHKQLFNEERYEVSEEVRIISNEIIDITGYK